MTNEARSPPDRQPINPIGENSFALQVSEKATWQLGAFAGMAGVAAMVGRDPVVIALAYLSLGGMLALSIPSVLHELHRRAPGASDQVAILTVLGGFAPLLVPLGLWTLAAETAFGPAFLPLALAWGILAAQLAGRPPGRWRRRFLLASAVWAVIGIAGSVINAFG